MTAPLNQTVLRIAFSSEDELNRKLCEVMRKRGFEVAPAQKERLTVGQLAKRINRPVSTVSRSLTRPTCPEFVCQRGKKRIVWLEPNDRLLSFLESIPTHTNPTARDYENQTT